MSGIRSRALLTSGLLLLATATRGHAQCDDPRRFLSSSTWAAFTQTVGENYLAPARLSTVDLAPAQLAKVLGHALGRQAHYVGEDASRRGRFQCLHEAAELGLTEGVALLSRLGGRSPAAAESERLVRALDDAARGFYDDEILSLTGVRPDAVIASVLDTEASFLGVDAPGPASIEEGASGELLAPEQRRCRFHLDPALYTDAKAGQLWALVRWPWRDGFYYDTWAIDPEWPSDHPMQLHNRLRADQATVLTGGKGEILRRVRELQQTCR